MAEVAEERPRSTFPVSRFRRSLIVGSLLFACSAWCLTRPPAEPIAYFGGWLLAKKFRQLEHLEEQRDVEVLAVGSSHVDTGFDAVEFTRATGAVAYNFGLGGMDLYLQSLYLREVLLPLVEPRTLFWELPDLPYLLRPMTVQYRSAPALSAATGLFGHVRVTVESKLPQQWKRSLPEWYRLVREPPEAEVDSMGRSSLERAIATGDRFAVVDAEERDYATEDEREARAVEAIDAFEQALDAALLQGTTVYLVMTPYRASAFERGAPYRKRALNNTVQVFRRRLEEVLASRRLALINLRYHAPITEDPGLFADDEHLDTAGARALTAILADVQQGKMIPERWSRVWSAAEVRALGIESDSGATLER